MTDSSEVKDAEIEIVADFIRRFREHFSTTQAISAATVALGLPALGQLERIELVLAEMERRDQLKEVYKIEGKPCYREGEVAI